MPRSSWSKKVARAAGTGGGRTNRGRVPWTYYGAILLVVVLGVVGTVVSKDRRNTQINNAGTSAAPAIGTTWNEAVAFDLCGKFAPNVPQSKSAGEGLTTQGDGIMHISPTDNAAAGKNATLGKWASDNNVKLTAVQVQLPKGKLYTAGDSCDGGKGQVYVKQFAYPGDPTGVLLKGNPTAIHLQDQLELVVAFVPPSKSGKIPAPPAKVVAKLKALAAAAAAASTTTTTPSTTTTPASGTTTTPASGTTTTPASGTTTVPSSGTTAPASGTTATTAASATTTAPSSTSTSKP
jgi:hypothetical protein